MEKIAQAFHSNQNLRERYRIVIRGGISYSGRPRLVKIEDPFFVVWLDSGELINLNLSDVESIEPIPLRRHLVQKKV